MATSTPWGMSQHSDKIAPGIMMYGTAGHGGTHLSKKRNEQVPEYMRHADGWYEEDCDWCIPALTFPSEYLFYYADREFDIIELALKCLRDYYPDYYEKLYDMKLQKGESMIRDEQIFYKKHAGDYIVISATMQDQDMVRVTATIGGLREYMAGSKDFLVSKADYNTRGKESFVIDLSKHKEIIPI